MNFLIRYCVCYISAQVADFMSSVGNRLIGGKSTVAVENFIAIGRPTMLLVAWHYRFSSCYVFRVFGVSVRAQLKAESRKLTNSTIRILLLGSFHQRRRDIIATRPHVKEPPVSDVTPKSVPDRDLEIRRGEGGGAVTQTLR